MFFFFLLNKFVFSLKKPNIKMIGQHTFIYHPFYLSFITKFFRSNLLNLIEYSAYQHPNKTLCPFIIYFDYQNSIYYNFFLMFSFWNSLSQIFSSSSWMERELHEFFNIDIYNLTDQRNLLLDYNKNYHPLLKTFPTSGFEEVYYDPFTQKIQFKKINIVEL